VGAVTACQPNQLFAKSVTPAWSKGHLRAKLFEINYLRGVVNTQSFALAKRQRDLDTQIKKKQPES
jgi:hypothetical protein